MSGVWWLGVVVSSEISLSLFGKPGDVAPHFNHQPLGVLWKLQTDIRLLSDILYPLQIGNLKRSQRGGYWQERDQFVVDHTSYTIVARQTHRN